MLEGSIDSFSPLDSYPSTLMQFSPAACTPVGIKPSMSTAPVHAESHRLRVIDCYLPVLSRAAYRRGRVFSELSEFSSVIKALSVETRLESVKLVAVPEGPATYARPAMLP